MSRNNRLIWRLVPTALVALGLFGPVAANAAGVAQSSPDAVAYVAVRDDYFDPGTISVPTGTTIRWTNAGADYHTVTSDAGAFGSGLLYPGMGYSRTFMTPGTYPYHCQIHRDEGMVGTVIVSGGGTVPPPSTGNLAQGKPMRASSSQPGHGPEMAVDGSLDTFWASSGLAAASDQSVIETSTDVEGSAVTSLGALPDVAPIMTGAALTGMQIQPATVVEKVAAAPDSHNNQWIYVDLQGTFALRQFRMQWTVGHHAKVYGVYIYRAGCGWCLVGRTMSGDGDDSLTLASPIQARYALLGLSYPSVPSGSYQLREWQIFGGGTTPPPADTNVALNRPAFASSAPTGYEARRATDGESASEWRSTQIPAWIYVDFGSTATIRRALLRWSMGTHASRYALYAFIGGGWRAIYSTSAGNGGDDLVSLPAVQTRYLLLYGTMGPSSYLGLREFEVYGSAIGSPYPSGTELSVAPLESEWTTEAAEDGLALPGTDGFDNGAEIKPDAFALPGIDAPSTEGLPSPLD